MNAKLFESALIHYGYHPEHFDFPGIAVFSRIHQGGKYFVGVLNCMAECQFTQVQLYSARMELKYKYPDSLFLLVAFSYDAYDVRQTLSGDMGHWIYDERDQKLMVFDDQPSEYLDLRQILEGTREPGHPQKSVWNYVTVTNILVAVNLIVFLIQEALGDTNNGAFLASHGALYSDSVIQGHEYYRILTSMFMHAGVRHIFGNMLTLFFLGAILEQYLGKIRFAVIYMVAGIAGNLLSLLYFTVYLNQSLNSVGASGAIFGVIGAMLYVVILHRGKLQNITLLNLMIYLFLSIYMGFTSTEINMAAHIGGLISGFLLAMVLYRKGGTYS